MTTGERIKEARTRAGISQEQLSERLNVSRSAVAKWEADVGIPDVDNLKAIAGLFGISVDYLLGVSENGTCRIGINLNESAKGNKFEKKDILIKEYFAEDVIYPLLANQKLTKPEKILDNILGFFTDASFGTPELIHSFENLDKSFYLIDRGEKSLLVMITDEEMIIDKLSQKPSDKFETTDWKFTKNKKPL